MSVYMKPIGEIKANLGLEPNGRIQKFFTNTCYKHMDKFVPYEYGHLRTIVDLDKSAIIYESEYALYMYKGKTKNGLALNYKTIGTGSYWDMKMKSVEMDDVVKEVQKAIDGG